MGLKYFRVRQKVTSAGNNYLKLDLPENGRLKVVRVRNLTKGWQIGGCVLALPGADQNNDENIGVLSGVQDGTITLGLSCDYLLGDYRRAIGKFGNCDVGDDIAITCGVES